MDSQNGRERVHGPFPPLLITVKFYDNNGELNAQKEYDFNNFEHTAELRKRMVSAFFQKRRVYIEPK